MKELRVCVAPWTGETSDTLISLGYKPNEEDRWLTHSMTREKMLELASKLLEDPNIGVMMRPAQSDEIDYIVFVDTARGRFSHR